MLKEVVCNILNHFIGIPNFDWTFYTFYGSINRQQKAWNSGEFWQLLNRLNIYLENTIN